MSGESGARIGAALVTGAGTGLGKTIALTLLAAGYDVAACDIDAAGLKTLQGEVTSSNRRLIVMPMNLRSEADIEKTCTAAHERLGPLDLLVNNAGVTIHKPALELTWDDWDAVHDVNLKASYFISRAVARRLIADDRPGSIISIASAHGIVGFPDRSAYGISKAGLIHLTKMLAVEWAPYRIRVNSIAPGTIMTPSREALLQEPAARNRMLGRIPLACFPTVEEVSQAVVFLAGSAASSITGHTLIIDGGTTIA